MHVQLTETPLFSHQSIIEKPAATCFGLTRQELIKLQYFIRFAIIFAIIYISIIFYLVILTISSMILGNRKLINFDMNLLFYVILPIFFTNYLGKTITFYAAYNSHLGVMQIACLSQIVAFFLDIYLVINVLKGGQRIQSGFIYDDLFVFLFIYSCIAFDVFFSLGTLVLTFQLALHGFIRKPKIINVKKQ